jgi:hypothetical protein
MNRLTGCAQSGDRFIGDIPSGPPTRARRTVRRSIYHQHDGHLNHVHRITSMSIRARLMEEIDPARCTPEENVHIHTVRTAS